MPAFRDNTKAHRFELETPEGASFADYRDANGVRLILHVETPDAARGKGHASRLMDAIVAHARANNIGLRAHCSFAAAYFRRYPKAGDVLA